MAKWRNFTGSKQDIEEEMSENESDSIFQCQIHLTIIDCQNYLVEMDFGYC